MSDKAYEIFKSVLSNRKDINNVTIDGYNGFLFLKVMATQNYEMTMIVF